MIAAARYPACQGNGLAYLALADRARPVCTDQFCYLALYLFAYLSINFASAYRSALAKESSLTELVAPLLISFTSTTPLLISVSPITNE